VIKRQRKKVVSADLDGTILDTFALSPNGIGVEVCYAMALRDMFGCEQLLENIGGLQNRASPQVIAAVLALDPMLGARGLGYYQRHGEELRTLVPHGKGAKCNGDLAATLTETLVRVRLKYLLPEISRQWPRPYDGVLDFLGELENDDGEIGIITSGHTLFVQKAFAIWGIKCPRLLVTDDDMRAMGLPPEKACKPSPVLMDALHMTAAFAGIDADVIAYVGDCPIKDRALAWNSNVRFGWFNPAKADAPRGFGLKEVNEFQFHDWNDLHKQLN
jgi:phosphoglycolate phosphatase-like HAD superfamily hydrolase